MSRNTRSLHILTFVFSLLLFVTPSMGGGSGRPHIILVMADDMGWGETSYRGHPVLKTPNLDAMAAQGLRFERFYAGGPVCSPTRATVMTGRSHDRCAVYSHGYPLRLQEKTLAQALRAAGYVTGHFGKWHLNGMPGPGAPILASDPRNPGVFGFEEWESVSNFFDRDPLLSHRGRIEEFKGDSSEVVVGEALKFIGHELKGDKPIFAVIWYGSPHSPFRAASEDMKDFGQLSEGSANHYGELVAMDRSIGTLRKGLRDFGIADNTFLMFCSDNGGLPEVKPETVGGLRGHKGSVFEGGIRVPAIIEWPSVIKTPRITQYPACTMDIFPTVADILGLPENVFIKPLDGDSLKPLLTAEIGPRRKPIPFRFRSAAALVDNDYKLLTQNLQKGVFELYNLQADGKEQHNLASEKPEIAARLKKQLLTWNESVEASVAGKDYPEGKLTAPDPEPIRWAVHPSYQPYLAEWQNRPEYQAEIKKAGKETKQKKK